MNQPETSLECHIATLFNLDTLIEQAPINMDYYRKKLAALESGEERISIDAQHGQYPVFGNLAETHQRINIVLQYRSGDQNVKGFEVFVNPNAHPNEKLPMNQRRTEVQVVDRDSDQAIGINIDFHQTQESASQVYLVQNGRRASDFSGAQNYAPMAADFRGFKFAALSRWEEIQGRKGFSRTPSYVGRNVVGDSDVDQIFQDPIRWQEYDESANLTLDRKYSLAQKLQFISELLRLFYTAKGYSEVEPIDVQKIFDDKSKKIKEETAEEEKQAEKDKEEFNATNIMNYDSSEIQFIVNTFLMLQRAATTYSSIKDVLGEDVVLDSVDVITNSYQDKVSRGIRTNSTFLRLLPDIISGWIASIKQDDEAGFLRKSRAIVKILKAEEDRLLKSLGSDSDTSRNWSWSTIFTKTA